MDTASSRQLSTSIITFALSLLNFSVDLDDCVNHNCSNGASCIDGINGYSCNCSVGFSGEHCENSKYSTKEIDTASNQQLSTWIITFALFLLNFSVDLDDCVNHNCSNGASCLDGMNGYSCNCSVGFSGEHCENSKYSTKEIDTASSCQLSTLIITFSLCLLNFSVDLDDCVNHNCSNGASCIDGINSYSCNCSAGFTGLNCETGRERTNKTPILRHKLNFQALVKLAIFINPVMTFSRHRRLREPHIANGASTWWHQYLLMQMYTLLEWLFWDSLDGIVKRVGEEQIEQHDYLTRLIFSYYQSVEFLLFLNDFF